MLTIASRVDVMNRLGRASAVALVIAVFAVRRAIEAWKGDACCATLVRLLTGEREMDSCCERR